MIDQARGDISEAVGGATLEASFGSVSGDGEQLAVTRPSGERMQRGGEGRSAVRFAVIERRSGDVVLMREYEM